MASSYHQLGMLAQIREDFDEAARQYQRALDINERLGNQTGLANSYHNLGSSGPCAAGTLTRRRGSISVP